MDGSNALNLLAHLAPSYPPPFFFSAYIESTMHYHKTQEQRERHKCSFIFLSSIHPIHTQLTSVPTRICQATTCNPILLEDIQSWLLPCIHVFFISLLNLWFSFFDILPLRWLLSFIKHIPFSIPAPLAGPAPTHCFFDSFFIPEAG